MYPEMGATSGGQPLTKEEATTRAVNAQWWAGYWFAMSEVGPLSVLPRRRVDLCCRLCRRLHSSSRRRRSSSGSLGRQVTGGAGCQVMVDVTTRLMTYARHVHRSAARHPRQYNVLPRSIADLPISHSRTQQTASVSCSSFSHRPAHPRPALPPTQAASSTHSHSTPLPIPPATYHYSPSSSKSSAPYPTVQTAPADPPTSAHSIRRYSTASQGKPQPRAAWAPFSVHCCSSSKS